MRTREAPGGAGASAGTSAKAVADAVTDDRVTTADRPPSRPEPDGLSPEFSRRLRARLMAEATARIAAKQ